MYRKGKMIRRFLLGMLGAGFILGSLTAQPFAANAADDCTDIIVDGSDVDQAAANRNGLTYKGFGLLSCNSTSDLLMDYKYQTPKAYQTLLDTMFGGEHPLMNHVKVEMGNDGNNSTGADSCTMRTEDEEADASRSPGFILAADARKVNPAVKVSVLRWEMPAWVQEAWNSDKAGRGHEAMYRWYKETFLDAYEKYGYLPDYVNPDKNETGVPDTDFIKWFRNRVQTDNEFPDYMTEQAVEQYHNMKIVASDEYISLNIVPAMRKDKEVYDAVDAIGFHYSTGTTDSTADYVRMADEDDKEVWYSEGCGSFSYTGYQKNKTEAYGAGTIGGYQSPLAMCDCMVKSAVYSRKTHYIFQPAIGSFYEGAQYDHKELLSAREPWAGSIHFDESIYLLSHFSKFAKTGWENETNTAGIWRYISAASGNDSSGTEHLRNEQGNPSYMTLASPDRKDFSTILVNNSDKTLQYRITLENMDIPSDAALEIWESETDRYMEYGGEIKAEDGSYDVTVKPFSIVTVTSLKCRDQEEYTKRLPEETTKYILDTDESGSKLDYSGDILYSDDFEYSSYSEDYLTERGNEPRYMVDQSGAFYVEDGKLVQGLEKKISQWQDNEPNTVVGDYRWMNYKAGVDVYPDESGTAGIVVRQQTGMAYSGSGYSLQISQDGKWQFKRRGSVLESGSVQASDEGKYRLSIVARGEKVTAFVDDEEVASYEDSNPEYFGRIKLFCNWKRTAFDNLVVEKLPQDDDSIDTLPYAGFLIDNADDAVSYSGGWNIKCNGSSNDWYRSTSETQEAGASFTVPVTGKGFALIGSNEGTAVLGVMVDGEEIDAEAATNISSNHGTSYLYYGLEEKEHEVTVTVKSGKFVLDAILPLGQPMPELPAEEPPIATPTETPVQPMPSEQPPAASGTPGSGVVPPAEITPTVQPPSPGVGGNNTLILKTPVLKKLKPLKKGVRISWKKVKTAKNYIIQRAVGKKGKFKTVKKVSGAKKTFWDDKTVKKGKQYYYRVRCQGKVKGRMVYSTYSKVKKVKIS